MANFFDNLWNGIKRAVGDIVHGAGSLIGLDGAIKDWAGNNSELADEAVRTFAQQSASRQDKIDRAISFLEHIQSYGFSGNVGDAIAEMRKVQQQRLKKAQQTHNLASAYESQIVTGLDKSNDSLGQVWSGDQDKRLDHMQDLRRKHDELQKQFEEEIK